MAKVEIYSSALCGFCRAAKQVLASKGVEFDEYSVDRQPAVHEEMMKRAGGRTSVLQIFVGGTHVGGFDDMMELEADDKLNGLLAAE